MTLRAEKDIETLSRIESRFRRERTRSERLAGLAVRTAGSTTFITLHIVWFAAWIVVNLGWVAPVAPFDPYPFAFLTLVVSLEAIFLTLLVLLAQNRISREADRRALLDLQINLMAERESTKALAILQRIEKHLGLEPEADQEAVHLAARTNVEKLLEAMEKQLASDAGD